MRTLLIPLVIFSILLEACPKSITAVKTQSYEPVEYFPMKKGYKWSYILTSIRENTSSLINTEVEEISLNDVRINSGGSVFHYIITEDGIMKKSAGYYILKKPLKRGTFWEFSTGGAEGKITVTETDQKISVRGREYSNCIITEETVKGQNIILRTYYAYGVGPVLIEQTALFQESAVLVLRAELMGYSFDPSIENPAE
ncbi:MAG: hypothetical protein N3B13_03415 [Deltaproteobacteria bacterium]|nr:hypothetical protein [Deltaproteobacteria bacterium]